MIMGGLKDKKNGVLFGNRSDVCWFCAGEQAAANHAADKRTGLTRNTAAEQLRGNLSGKPIFRFPISGGPYIICKDHMKQILSDMETLEGTHETKNA